MRPKGEVSGASLVPDEVDGLKNRLRLSTTQKNIRPFLRAFISFYRETRRDEELYLSFSLHVSWQASCVPSSLCVSLLGYLVSIGAPCFYDVRLVLTGVRLVPVIGIV